MSMKSRLMAMAGLVALASFAHSPAQAQQDFYAGKNLTMIIGFGPGGGYDLWGRTVARHIVNHLPGKPTAVPQNMPGAGSYHAANHLFNIAPKDGSVMGIIARDAPLGPLTGAEGTRFDPLKLSWIGTPNIETNVCIARAGADVQTVDDLYKKTFIVGDTGPGTGTRSYPKALSALLGMNFKLVSGFPSSANVFLAMERGEVDGICESLDSVMTRKPEWLSSGKIKIVFYGALEPINEPVLKGIPFILDLAKNEEQKKEIAFLYAGQGIGRPFVAPPNLPPERLAMLRKAFMATMKDPEFISDVTRQKMELDPHSGEYLEKLIQEIYATPKAIVQKIGDLIK